MAGNKTTWQGIDDIPIVKMLIEFSWNGCSTNFFPLFYKQSAYVLLLSLIQLMELVVEVYSNL